MKITNVIILIFVLATSIVFATGEADCILALPLEIDVLDDSLTLNNGTVDGATLSALNCISETGCYEFDGINDDIVTLLQLNIAVAENRTFSYWARVNDTSIDQMYMSYGAEVEPSLWGLRYSPPTSYLMFWGIYRDWGTGVQIAQGEWIHYIWTYDGAKIRVYVNNSEIGTGSSLAIETVNSVLTLGNRLVGDRRLKGALNMVLVYDRVITADERAVLYNDHVFYNPFDAPPEETQELHLVLKNSGGVKLSLTNITESQEFFINANYTNTTTPILSSFCNFTALNISAYFSLTSPNATLNLSTDIFTLEISESNDSILYDSYKFEVCRLGLKVPVEILINGIEIDEIDQNIIPLCNLSTHEENVNITSNNDKSIFNISILCDQCNGGNKKIKVVSNDKGSILHYRRTFSEHTEPLTYNSTTELYEYSEYPYSFIESGINNAVVSLTCNSTTNISTFSIIDAGLNSTILSINDVPFTSGMQIEANTSYFILTETKGDIVSEIEFNVTYSNGTVIKSVSTEFMNLTKDEINIDGIYNITLRVTDDEGGVYNLTDYFLINDSIDPTITWNFPLEDLSSTVVLNTSQNFYLVFNDLNLFAFQVDMINPNGVIVQSWNATNLNITSYSFQELFTPNMLTFWTVNATVTDDHTLSEISDYRHDIKGTELTFNFSRKDVGDLLRDDDQIKIDYISGLDLDDIVVTKEKDRYKFKYNFFGADRKKESLFQWRVYCENIIYRAFSGYKAHFVCPVTKNWIDFDMNFSGDYKIKKCGSDCFEVRLKLKEKDSIEFNSLGGLNEISESVSYEVVEATETTTSPDLDLDGYCLNSLSSVMLFFVLIFFYVALIIISFMFNSIFIRAFAFAIGLILGLMILCFSGFLAFIFFIFNVGIMMETVVHKK